ncbi:hypothetical protein ACRC3O_000115 [Salmonella enterica]
MQLNAKAREFLRQYHNGLRESYGATDGDRWFALSDPKETGETVGSLCTDP